MVETSGTSKYSASAMAGCATSQSCACTTSGRHGRLRCALDSQTGADHRMPHRQRPRHHVGAEVELVRVLRGCDNPYAFGDFVGRRVSARVGAAGTTAEHDDLVSGRRQRRRQLIHVPTEPADHHRRVLPRHHQDFHRSFTSGRATAECQQFAACRVQTRSLAGKGVIAEAAERRARRTSRRRGSSRRPGAARARRGRTPARRRSHGWRAHAGARDSARSRRRNPCSP